MEEATRRSYQFWDTQPVPKLGIDHLCHYTCSMFFCLFTFTIFKVTCFLFLLLFLDLTSLIFFLVMHIFSSTTSVFFWLVTWRSINWRHCVKLKFLVNCLMIEVEFCRLFVGETVTSHGCIEPDKDHIREEPYSLPQGFTWDTLDLGNSAVVRHTNH